MDCSRAPLHGGKRAPLKRLMKTLRSMIHENPSPEQNALECQVWRMVGCTPRANAFQTRFLWRRMTSPDPPILAFFGKNARIPRENKDFSSSAEPLESLEKRAKNAQKAGKTAKQKRRGKQKKQGLEARRGDRGVWGACSEFARNLPGIRSEFARNSLGKRPGPAMRRTLRSRKTGRRERFSSRGGRNFTSFLRFCGPFQKGPFFMQQNVIEPFLP